MKKRTKAATASRKAKGRKHGRTDRRQPGAKSPGAKRVSHPTRSIRHPADVVAGGASKAECVPQQLDATGRTGVDLWQARREAAVQIAVIAGTLRQRANDAREFTVGRMPLNDVIDLSIDERIKIGDAEALFDAVAEARDQLGELQEQIAETLHTDMQTMVRISDVRRRQDATGRQWRGSSWTNQETGTTDRVGKEAGGAGQ